MDLQDQIAETAVKCDEYLLKHIQKDQQSINLDDNPLIKKQIILCQTETTS